MRWFTSLNIIKWITNHLTKINYTTYAYKKSIQNLNSSNSPAVDDNNQHPTLVSIILINNNNIKKILPSLVKHSSGITYELIIINNPAKKNIANHLDKHYCKHFSFKILENSSFTSYAEASNLAVKAAQGKYIVFLKSDIEPSKDWLHHLLTTATSVENIGMVGSRLIYPCSTKVILKHLFGRINCVVYHTGIAFRNKGGAFTPYNIGQGKPLDDKTILTSQQRSSLSSSCLLLLRSVYIKSGGMDESFQLYNDDIDLGLRLLTLGYTNYYNADSVLVYHRKFFPLREKMAKKSRKKQADDTILQKKWFHSLKRSYWSEKIYNKPPLFSETPLTIAIAVTDHGDKVTAGDYFTAQELAIALESYGWKIVYLSKKKGEWYKLSEDIDILLNLLDSYDLNKIPKRKKQLITIAWARNWFDSWCNMSCFNDYTIVFSSSQIACDYIQQHSKQLSYILPLATNPERFAKSPTCINADSYKSDIAFTGSYWDYPRDIMNFLSQESINKYSFAIYGVNWEKFKQFKPHNKGFISYVDMPCVYHNTKIIIDDANHVTKPYGSVNSRVFDALISGSLVITNGIQGAKEQFHGKLPYYETQDELDQLLDFYLNNENERIAKVKSLQQIIINKHTYTHRAKTLRHTLIAHTLSTSIAIKVPCPSWNEANSWGDYHLAVSLKKELEKYNYRVILQMLPEWDNQKGKECDIALVLRGLSRYTIQPHQINIMWNISHPDKVSIKEYEEYNKVYIASEYWANKISEQVSTPVESMLQCTDPELFFEPSKKEKQKYKQALLFVGNSRKVYRKIIQDLLPTKHDLAIYGSDWSNLVSDNYIKGQYIANKKLYQYYGSTDILLNDHWDDMRAKGFISNRIFDALACGAFVLSDNISNMGELGKFIQIYNTPEELKELIDYYLSSPTMRKQKAQQGMKLVLDKHTFKDRAKQFDLYIQNRLNATTHRVSL
jgi:spore maturation protein CgeB/GT2 family glycosyltransferase